MSGLVLCSIQLRYTKIRGHLMQRAFSETTSFLAALRVVWAAGLGTRSMQGTILFMEHLQGKLCTTVWHTSMILYVQGAQDSLRRLLQRSLHWCATWRLHGIATCRGTSRTPLVGQGRAPGKIKKHRACKNYPELLCKCFACWTLLNGTVPGTMKRLDPIYLLISSSQTLVLSHVSAFCLGVSAPSFCWFLSRKHGRDQSHPIKDTEAIWIWVPNPNDHPSWTGRLMSQ